MNENGCKDHSGVCVDVGNLKLSDMKQWDMLNKMQNRMTDLMIEMKSGANRILGGLVVGLVLLALNLVVAFTK